MALRAYVTSTDPKKGTSVKLEDKEILATLGPKEDNIAVQMQELFTAVTQSVASSLDVESHLGIEITGSITLKADAGTKFLVFHIGGETAATGSMKVTLSTTLKPKKESKGQK